MMKTIRREEISAGHSGIVRAVVNRWAFFAGVFLTAFLFARQAFDIHLQFATGALFLLNVLITLISWSIDGQDRLLTQKSLTFAGYFADSAFLSVLISHTGGFASPFIICYAYLILNLSEQGDVANILLYGALFHLSFAGAFFHLHGDLSFYLDPRFLVVCLIYGTLLFRAARLTRKIREQVTSLRRSKLALEEFAKDLKNSQESMERLSHQDPVTGLYNFRYFRRLLVRELERAKRYKTGLSLLIIDVDHFRTYNEILGHQLGDQALKNIAEIIKANIRDLDIVARYVADEFILLLQDADVDLAMVIANRIKQTVEESFFERQDQLPSGNLTVSIGISAFPESAQEMNELIKAAEDALYKVQLSRKNLIKVYSNIVGELRQELSDSTSMAETLQTLLLVVNARDRYTFGHSERVVKYALAIGRELGLDSVQLNQLKYGGFFHDIGKIEIDREILNKREPLTSVEWELVKKHPLFGVSILEPIHGLDSILCIVRNHHERFDGRGYPDALAGEGIPLTARILAVADSYDAMRSNRPYRQALSRAAAVQELLEGRGKQFDPKAVDAFLKVIEEAEFEIDKAVN